METCKLMAYQKQSFKPNPSIKLGDALTRIAP